VLDLRARSVHRSIERLAGLGMIEQTEANYWRAIKVVANGLPLP
jgi:hypothetical protein